MPWRRLPASSRLRAHSPFRTPPSSTPIRISNIRTSTIPLTNRLFIQTDTSRMLLQPIPRSNGSLLEHLPDAKQKSGHGPNNLIADPQTFSQLTTHSSP